MKNERIILIAFLILFAAAYIFLFISVNSNIKKLVSFYNESTKETVILKGEEELYRLLSSEIVDVEGWNCVDYVEYYKKALSKYDNLDIREIRKLKTCQGMEGCNSTHATLLIGGREQECILDQRTIKCISLNI